MTVFPLYASVIPDIGIDKTLDYGVPLEFLDRVRKGSKVRVPIRGSLRYGYVLALKPEPEVANVKPIAELLDAEIPLTENLFELALWMARYYCSSLGDVLKTMLPASVRRSTRQKQQLFVMRGKTLDELTTLCAELRRKSPAQAHVLDVMLKVTKGILLSELLELAKVTRAPVDSLCKKGALIVDIVRVDRSPLINEEYVPTRPKLLNPEQATALKKIEEALAPNRFEVHLLHGITGSGKTEIYLQAIHEVLAADKGTIVLVPEISLTPQTIERFRSRFSGHIAVLHHRLSHGERYDEWGRLARGEAKIAIGARSAVFSPIPNLGLIIVDEEHEASYKQTDGVPCYHARDVAVMRGKLAQCVVILGSATPSIESYQNAMQGKYHLSTLQLRADSASMPKVKIVDMREEKEKSGGYTTFSSPLLNGIKERAQLGEQTILFLNRRGYHTSLSCKGCGQAVQCPHCDVALTFHKADEQLLCHLCGFTLTPAPRACPQCHSSMMKFQGVGTEQVQKALHAVLPDIRTLRVDADTTRHKGSHQRLLRDFGTGKADVLIGTQMIAKGLHFPQVTLVGVLNSDHALQIPDFRSAEVCFQLMTQVSGRAGRGTTSGEVIIQTFMPNNRTIQLAAQADYATFIGEELKSREFFQYPPFSQLAKLLFTGLNAEQVTATAEQFRKELQEKLPADFELHPVLPCGHPKIKDRYRFQFLVRGHKGYVLSQAIERVQQGTHIPGSVKLLIDINPLSTWF